MNDENVITIEIRGHEPAAVEAAQRIAELFLASGPLLATSVHSSVAAG
ncbi:hypothetical protein [Streptomyces erythrochromogenes]|nr:hypothetical protein OG364_00250 [Streptomyces erythrochromogenes]WST98479.1 hypothetical protein OG364_41285 [Streptomyces erythrochromogenes]